MFTQATSLALGSTAWRTRVEMLKTFLLGLDILRPSSAHAACGGYEEPAGKRKNASECQSLGVY